MGWRGGDRDESNTRRREERQAQWDRICSVNGRGEYGINAFLDGDREDMAPSALLNVSDD